MTKGELKEQIISFYEEIKLFRTLLVESRNPYIPEIEKNIDEITIKRKELIRVYAKLELYIKKYGKNPKINDGVWKIWYSPYDNAFSSDILLRVGPSIDAMIDDLDYIIGKLENMNADEKINDVQSEAEMKTVETQNNKKILIQIDTAINLAEQNLLKSEELNDLVSELKRYKTNLKYNDILKRKLEKLQREPNTVWSDPKGYAIGGKELLTPWQEIFLELVSPEKTPSQKYFRPGSRDEIMEYLKPLLSSTKTIKIYDNFIGEDLLKLLENTLPEAEVYILGGGGEIDMKFMTKLPAFKTYFSKNVKARKIDKRAHARFYIVDDLVYHVDPSLKGRGADKATIISPVNKEEAEKIKTDFDDWWKTGTDI